MTWRWHARLAALRAAALLMGGGSRTGGSALKRILVMRPDHMGDLLLSIPALQALRALRPHWHIGLLVGPWNEELALHIPSVDEVLTLPFPWFDRRPKGGWAAPYQLLRREAAKLQTGGWDAALVLRHDFWWGAMLAAAAGVPVRIGYDMAECRPFLTHAVPSGSLRHETEQCLTLVQAMIPGGASLDLTFEERGLRLTREEEQFSARWLLERGIQGPVIAVHPGAGAPVKLWPVERFASVAQALAADSGAAVMVTGSAAEHSLVRAVVERCGGTAYEAAGLRIGELAALLRRCTLAVGTDSGVMHLAAAVGTPTVRLYGPVDPARFGPAGRPCQHVVVRSEPACVPCNRLDIPDAELPLHPCMRSISVEAVVAAARALRAATAPAG